MKRRSIFDEIALKDVISFVVDNRGKTVPVEDSGIPLIATANISNSELYPSVDTDRYVSEEIYSNWFRSHPQVDDVILTNKGSKNGEVCLVPNPVEFCIAQDMVALRANKKIIHPKYLLASLRSSLVQKRIKLLNVDAVIPHFKKSDFDKLFIPLPSLDVQEFIGQIYFDISLRIELNRKNNETLEGIAKAIFKSWFIDFDPVRAKAEGRSTGLPDEISSLFSDSFDDSELGEIPRGWTVSEIGNVVECLGGGTPSTKETTFWKNGTNFWATPKDLSSLAEPFLLDTAKKITIDGVRKISSGVLPVGTVLLSSRAPVGYVAVTRIPVSVNQGFIALKPSGNLSTEYLLNWTLANVQQFKDRASGTTFPEISKKSFRPIPILIPKKEVLRNFTSQTSSIYERIVSSMKETAILISLRDAFLPKLISGELRVPDAEKILEEVGI